MSTEPKVVVVHRPSRSRKYENPSNRSPAAKAFFLDLGLEMMGEGEVEGELAEQLEK
jgi:hypothetical protein